MAKIAIDIDSTLYDFTTPFREAFLDLAEQDPDLTEEDKDKLFKGLYFPWLEWRAPVDAVGLPLFERALARVHANDMILSQRPFAGARETLQELVDAGHELLYVSNRASESLGATSQWLMANNFPVGELQVIEPPKGKMEAVSDCQFIIDDRPRTLVEFVYDHKWFQHTVLYAWHYVQQPHGLSFEDHVRQAGRKGFGLMYEYNRNLTDVRGIYLAPTWAGLRFYLGRKGVLDV